VGTALPIIIIALIIGILAFVFLWIFKKKKK